MACVDGITLRHPLLPPQHSTRQPPLYVPPPTPPTMLVSHPLAPALAPRLCSERLAKEPELLRADQEQLRRQLQDTAVGHYRSFVGATRCLADLRTQLAAATGHLDALAADLPKLQAACDTFRQDAAAIAGRRADNRQLYSALLQQGHCAVSVRFSQVFLCRLPTARSTCNRLFSCSVPLASTSPAPPPIAGSHPTVLEILEVPQLMDTCCRSGNFDEALDLRAFVNKVGRRPCFALVCW